VLDLDLRAFLALYGGTSGALAPEMLALTQIGGGWAILALIPLLGHPRTRRFAAALALCIAVQAALVWALKMCIGRVRPWVALGLPPPFGAPHDGSFPSGHAAGSLCVAAFVALSLPVLWPDSRWYGRVVSVLALFVAALVALSRVYLGAHFPSDVLGGALFGGLVGVVGGALYASQAKRRRPTD
jgi:undecaprenyl-diphosphatase